MGKVLGVIEVIFRLCRARLAYFFFSILVVTIACQGKDFTRGTIVNK